MSSRAARERERARRDRVGSPVIDIDVQKMLLAEGEDVVLYI
jgi:hypothetical protein